MTQQDNGGAAFPQMTGGGEFGIRPMPGMSLRDYAAIKFMAALISTQDGMANISKLAKEESISGRLCAAKVAYDFADALLAARSAK